MKKKRIMMVLAGLCLGGSAAFFSVHAAQIVAYQKYPLVMDKRYYVPSAAADKKIFPNGLNAAFGSGLSFEGYTQEGAPRLLTITDRGPNLDGMDVIYNGKKYTSKLFPAPDFHPEIGEVVLADGKAAVVKVMPIKDPSGNAISGRPVPPGETGSSGEVALSSDLKLLLFDENGLDTEAIARDRDGNIWISDEYGPFVVKMDRQARILEKYSPKNGLPAIAGERTPNRGAEGLTIMPNGHILFLVQSILTNGGKTKNAVVCRLFDWNPTDCTYKTYAYPLEGTYKKMGDAKLGDAYAIDNHRVLIIEQGKQADKSMMNRVYMVDLSTGTDVTNTKINGKDIEFASREELAPYLPVKTLIADLRRYGWDTEKAEGLTMSYDHKTMFVSNDNDFGIATTVRDAAHKKAKISDYTYDATSGMIYYQDKTGRNVPAHPQIDMEVGPDTPQIWSFTFDRSLDGVQSSARGNKQ